MKPSSMSATMKRVLADPKVRANMKAGALRRWAKATERKWQATRMKKALGWPEVRAAMSAGAKRRHREAKARN